MSILKNNGNTKIELVIGIMSSESTVESRKFRIVTYLSYLSE